MALWCLALTLYCSIIRSTFSYLIVECSGDYDNTFHMFQEESRRYGTVYYANMMIGESRTTSGYLYHYSTEESTYDCESYNLSSPILPPFFLSNKTASFLLIANYSHCMLEKIEMARGAGYDAVLTYTVNDTNTTITNSIISTGFSIALIEYNTVDTFLTRVIVPITNNTIVKLSLSAPAGNPDVVLPAVLAIVAFLLCLFVSLFLYHNIQSYMKKRSRRKSLALQDGRLVLPTRIYGGKKEREEEKHTTCNICLEDFKKGKKVWELPCKHIFHLECIDEWLSRHSCICPNCKMNLRRHYGSVLN